MVDKATTRRVRHLRQNANFPEQRAWTVLRSLRRHGFPVRRQHPIGPYVVDFAIVRAKLVIEIDGGIHRLDSSVVRDKQRDNYFEKEGWRVLHIEAADSLDGDYLMCRVTEALNI